MHTRQKKQYYKTLTEIISVINNGSFDKPKQILHSDMKWPHSMAQ